MPSFGSTRSTVYAMCLSVGEGTGMIFDNMKHLEVDIPEAGVRMRLLLHACTNTGGSMLCYVQCDCAAVPRTFPNTLYCCRLRSDSSASRGTKRSAGSFQMTAARTSS